MAVRQTLYEMLGVAQDASTAQLQSAYRERVSELEAARASMSSQDHRDKAQLLRVALSTLSDPVTRVGYDAKLSDSAASQVIPPLALGAPNTSGVSAAAPAAGSSAEVRADALSLRADALALRADAMLVRAGLEVPGAGRDGVAGALGSGLVKILRRVASALGLLVMIGVASFSFTRCMGDSSAPRAAPPMDARAMEKAALQEYYQTHGVRPANMAELELLEAERRRRASQERQQDINRDTQERQARQERQFEQDARRRGEEVSRQLRWDEERARREAQQEAERERQEKRMKQEMERAQQEAEQSRIEREQERWRQELRR